MSLNICQTKMFISYSEPMKPREIDGLHGTFEAAASKLRLDGFVIHLILCGAKITKFGDNMLT